MAKKISDITTGRKIDPSNKIILEETQNDLGLITIKPEGFSAKLMFSVFFTTFWLGFITIWTFFAATASFLFAAFSAPFWLVGLGLLFGIISSLFGVQEFIIRESDLIIRKRTPFTKGETIIPYKDLISIEKKNHLKMDHKTRNSFRLMTSSSSDSGLISETPVITYNKGNLFVGEHLSNSDKEWLVNYLNEKIVPKMRFISFDYDAKPESPQSYTPQSRDLN
tara:strand:- start:14565 stop:15233 length:669 start_codon:yes stop_codon:yes gene_type:complete